MVYPGQDYTVESKVVHILDSPCFAFFMLTHPIPHDAQKAATEVPAAKYLVRQSIQKVCSGKIGRLTNVCTSA